MRRITSIRSAGFTLVELIIAMVTIGVLSAVVMTNINAKARHDVTTQADQLRRDLSHIQLLAISTSARLRLTVNPGGASYTVTSCTTTTVCSTPVTDPATGGNFSVTLATGVTFTAPAALPNTLDFDSLGRPVAGATLTCVNPACTYTLNGSNRSVTVTVLPVSGFAQTTY